MEMSGGTKGLVRLLVPNVEWTLEIILVEGREIDAIADSYKSYERFRYKKNLYNLLFVREKKASLSSTGVRVSTWVNGDPQVCSTRVTYDYVSEYKSIFRKGYGSRLRSSCFGVNSYRDKQFSMRAQPSPLIYDGDIDQHQYFSATQQRSCLLQLHLETILHNLTHDVSRIASRVNPTMMNVVACHFHKVHRNYRPIHVCILEWFAHRLM